MSELQSTGLSVETIKKIQQVFSGYPEIDQVFLYGSRAKGDYRNGSDIDLTIMGDLLSQSQLTRIENDLDDLLLPYKIDLCLYLTIENQDLVDHIQRVGILFFKPGTDHGLLT
ncbi:MAG: nucleotidyltransferase domain-containing protein [Gammaproteobacteria bacterium]|nr:nucleotidyltransferase domain-containing protein [Gammaproteobacteria bacterium]